MIPFLVALAVGAVILGVTALVAGGDTFTLWAGVVAIFVGGMVFGMAIQAGRSKL